MGFGKTDIALVAVLAVAGTIGYFSLTSRSDERKTDDASLASVRLKPENAGGDATKRLLPRRLKRESKVAQGVGGTNRLDRGLFTREAEDAISKDLLAKILAELTPERRRAVAMRETLDLGDRRKALHEARALMDSKDRLVRLAVVGTLGWIGLEALGELTEMLNDADPEVSKEAIEQWQFAYKELEDDSARAQLIVEMIGMLDKQEDVDWMLMEFPPMDESISLAALSDIAQQYKGQLAGESSLEMYDHIAGEAYVSPEAAAAKIAAIEAERNVDGQVEKIETIDLDAIIEARRAELAERQSAKQAEAQTPTPAP